MVHGRWGPCIQSGKKFFTIPAGKEPVELTLEECLQIAGFKKGKVKGKVQAVAGAEGKTKEKKVKTAKVTKTPAVSKKPKLKIVKAKRRFANKRK